MILNTIRIKLPFAWRIGVEAFTQKVSAFFAFKYLASLPLTLPAEAVSLGCGADVAEIRARGVIAGVRERRTVPLFVWL
jgi:hypothetical protein